jgi:hypothetical protein
VKIVNERTGEFSPAMTDSIRRIGEVNFQILAMGYDCEVGAQRNGRYPPGTEMI